MDFQALTKLMDFQALTKLTEQYKNFSIAEQFQANPKREEDFSFQAGPLNVDLSRNHIDTDWIKAMLKLCTPLDVPKQIQDFFDGAMVNPTEKRSALHPALRLDPSAVDAMQTSPIKQSCLQTRAHIKHWCQVLEDGSYKGASNQSIDHIVHIGIGGSDLGPRMVTRALEAYYTHKLQIDFVANVDGHEIDAVLKKINPHRTLFIVVSKTFSTEETLLNATIAKQFLQTALETEDVSRHFIAVSNNIQASKAFGIPAAHCIAMDENIGGRYSLWSGVGLSIALAIGLENYQDFLHGAHLMDKHFQTAPLQENVPFLMALVHIWYLNGFAAPSRAILPYDSRLQFFPNFLQQLLMESLGKSVNKNGQKLSYPVGGIIFGDVGSNAQHAFMQLVHQSQDWVPVDFIIAQTPHHDFASSHASLMAHLKGQRQALVKGRSLDESKRELEERGLDSKDQEYLAAHLYIPGNKPSTTIMLETLDPMHLGALIALYEHQTFSLSVLWDINAFDQFGVELGKACRKAYSKA